MVNIFKYIALVVFLTSCSLLNPGDTPSRVHSTVRDSHSLIYLNTLLVQPVQNGSGRRGLAQLPIDANDILFQAALDNLDLQVVSAKDLGEIEGVLKESDFERYRAKFGVDGVLLLTVSSYEEREGSSIGVNTPAKVSFEILVVSTVDSNPIWKASYSLTDSAVSENLLVAKQIIAEKRGKGWLTARQIFEMGITKSLTELNELRNQQFSVHD